jgi:hypothetical protein
MNGLNAKGTNMKIDNNIDISGTSFHGTTIRATLKQMIGALGASIQGGDKTTNEWAGRINNQVFTVYDWKEGYFTPETPIDWHIGGFNQETTDAAKEAIFELLVTKTFQFMNT